MNKQGLIDKVAKEARLTKQAAEQAINAFVSTVQTEVKRGGGVKIVGFGTFIKARYKARNGRNPQTGAAIKIPAHSRPKFKPHDTFIAKVK